MQHYVNRSALKRKYAEDLFANEVMLLPYYIASLNIEHAYYELTGEYAPFEGICFVDTLDIAEAQQLSLFSEENTERVEREKNADITVIIGNPPYNVGQLNENDNNKNRKYPIVDEHIANTYVKDSKATLRRQLYDMYVRFFRWAADRLRGQDGIVCYVSNNSFVDQIAFDGMRKHLADEFTQFYHIDLHGNVRQNPKLSGTTHNVFGIQVGVGITVAVRHRGEASNETHVIPNEDTDETHVILNAAQRSEESQSRQGTNNEMVRFAHHDKERRNAAQIFYHRVPETWTKIEKLSYLTEAKSISGVAWQQLQPDAKQTWRTAGLHADFDSFMPMGTKEAKVDAAFSSGVIFKHFSTGIMSGRDSVVYDFQPSNLAARMNAFIDSYNGEVDRWIRSNRMNNNNADDFVDYSKLKWSRNLKRVLAQGRFATFSKENIIDALYRPYVKTNLYFNGIVIDERGQIEKVFPLSNQRDNLVICVVGAGGDYWTVFSANTVVDYKCGISGNSGIRCFPFYVYDEDGTGRRENITDWSLQQFQAAYATDDRRPTIDDGSNEQSSAVHRPSSRAITKRDIFHYVYAMLHHPHYRARYAENLKRELPRIPLVGIATENTERTESELTNTSSVSSVAETFWRFVAIGARLAALHLDYETAPEYPLTWIENRDVPFSWRVEKMKLARDKSAVVVNQSLTLAGLPPQAFAYRLGNRAALEWVIDQYQVKTDKRSGIVSDPNRADDDEYIVRLVGRVVHVSVETAKLVAQLPALA